MKTITQWCLLLAITCSAGCATIFIPAKQKVTIQTNNSKSTVYVDDESVGEGTTIKTKLTKDGPKQVVVQAPGFKDANYVMLPNRRHGAFWPLFAVDLTAGGAFLFLPALWDLSGNDKFFRYPVSNTFNPNFKFSTKPATDKYIKLEAVRLKVADKEKDLRIVSSVTHSSDLIPKLEAAEKTQITTEKRQEERNKRKKSSRKKLNEDSKSLEFEDTKMSPTLFETLKKTGYIDTVSKVFHDNNNTIVLEGVIAKATIFNIHTVNNNYYNKAKLFITWNIKNSYGEKVDSISGWAYSADFIKVNENMFADAVDNSYLGLLKNKRFTRHLSLDTNYRIAEAPISIPAPANIVKEVSEATAATVTIKRKDGGHGSGFAISNDGFILTNYHVVAGASTVQQAEISVLLSDGQEVPVKLVRYNRMRDIALLKVEKNFEKAFALSNQKGYKNLMEVYTIGTPKSIELGQSVSIGLISNERRNNNADLLQLSMTVNHGNSGGPLFSKDGSLQGIVTGKLVGFATEGVGFAIPSYLVPSYLNIITN